MKYEMTWQIRPRPLTYSSIPCAASVVLLGTTSKQHFDDAHAPNIKHRKRKWKNNRTFSNFCSGFSVTCCFNRFGRLMDHSTIWNNKTFVDLLFFRSFPWRVAPIVLGGWWIEKEKNLLPFDLHEACVTPHTITYVILSKYLHYLKRNIFWVDKRMCRLCSHSLLSISASTLPIWETTSSRCILPVLEPTVSTVIRNTSEQLVR